MCLPIIGAVVGIASSVVGAVGAHQDAQAQADYQNESARRNYEHNVLRREAEWQQTLSIWGNKRVDFANQSAENYSAADRAYATEQAKLNETFMQAAFQKQDMLSQLIQGRGSLAASGRSGKSVAKMDQSMIAAFGRNNAIIAENLASARNAMIRRNDQTRSQMMSANNQAWSQVAIAPSPGVAPPVPVMAPGPSGIGLVSGILGGVASGIGAWNQMRAPDGGNLNQQHPTSYQGQTAIEMPGGASWSNNGFSPSPFTPNSTFTPGNLDGPSFTGTPLTSGKSYLKSTGINAFDL